MKKFLAVFLLISICITAMCSSVFALMITYGGNTREYTGPEVSLILNENKFRPTQDGMPPIILENRTLVPVREVFEELGGKVEWESTTRKVTVTFEDKKIELVIDSLWANVNGEKIALDVPAKIINSKTMVPVRFISERGGLNVEWEPTTYTVSIYKQENNNQTTENENKEDKDNVQKTIFDLPEFTKEYEEILMAYRNGEFKDDDDFKELNILNEEDLKNFLKFGFYKSCISEYQDAIKDEYDILFEETLESDKALRPAQLYYMLANNITSDKTLEKDITNYFVPSQKNSNSKLTPELVAALDRLSASELEKYEKEIEKIQKEIAVYEIKKDISVEEIGKNIKLYGDENGKETWFVMSNGVFFTLPGFPVKQNDGCTRYYVAENFYYTVADKAYKTKNPDVIVLNKPIQAEDLGTFKAIEANEEPYIFNNINRITFQYEIGDYIDQILIESLNIRTDLGMAGLISNNAQAYYMLSKGLDINDFKEYVKNYTLPEGYVLPKTIQSALGITENESNKIVAYLMDDSKISGYEKASRRFFYGNYNGKEQHFVTSNGLVFTLPGIAIADENGDIRYYIDSKNHYYTVSKQSSSDVTIVKEPIQGSDLKEVYSEKVNN